MAIASMHAHPLTPAPGPSKEKKGLTRAAEIILADLRALIADLGKNGGLQNGSVYDTAQVVRLAPPEQGTDMAVEWLLEQQHADGGWDNPRVLRARDTPTLAAILALHVRGKKDKRTRRAIERGLKFLHKQRPFWTWTEQPDDLLVGVELTLPRLLKDAKALELKVPVGQYAALIKLGERRCEKLSRMKIIPGTPPVHSWEGWGTEPDPALLDKSGGVGLSPAATAAWLHAAEGRPELAESCASARRYLKNAEAGTDVGLPGVVPPSWPINLMEQQWGLYALLCAGLLNHPRLADVVSPHLDVLGASMRSEGIGFTEFFMPDGDCTAVTLALLKSANRPVNLAVLDPYKSEHHCRTYPFESNASLTTTAHAVMALNIIGEDSSRWVQALFRSQAEDGRWLLDKWQTSWLYVTAHVMHAIQDAAAMRTSIKTLLRLQKEDGGWGAGDHSTSVETAFAVPVLIELQDKGVEEGEAIRHALERANRYLQRAYRPFVPNREPMWIAKALYCPFRMDRAFELSAMLALALKEG
ncbi:hypothetical protein [Archangium sp.]|uniref:hypothetical protein n=1 Tax=Archangium sp. TaxID=1872627 RepID=UPI002D7161EA|nr:hypothetical protein [Archangium sp.]HYO53616.1 hypothetical protein [Archangium sp.]